MGSVMPPNKMRLRVVDLGTDGVQAAGWVHPRAVKVGEGGTAYIDPYAPIRSHRNMVEAPVLVQVDEGGSVTVNLFNSIYDWVALPESYYRGHLPIDTLIV